MTEQTPPRPAADDTPPRPKSAPKLPDEATATKEDWKDFQQEYAGWVERATDEDLLAEMAAVPEAGRPLSPAEAWMYHQCELRRRRPTSRAAARRQQK